MSESGKTTTIWSIASLSVAIIVGLLGYIAYQLNTGNEINMELTKNLTEHVVRSDSRFEYKIEPAINTMKSNTFRINSLDGRVTFLEAYND